MTLLSIANLSVRYAQAPSAALENMSLDIDTGETLCVVGESGSGKSTLATAIMGLLPRDASVSGIINWQDSRRPPRRGREVGMVFQDPVGSLDPVMTAGGQISEVAKSNLGLSGEGSRSHAHDLLRRVGFEAPEPIFAAYPHQLSGGQAQRVAIACALAAKPKLMIADESTSALDTLVQAGVVALLRRLVAEEALSLIFITHDLALARQIGNRVMVLEAGKIARTGDFDDLLRNPGSPYVEKLLRSRIGLTSPRMVSHHG